MTITQSELDVVALSEEEYRLIVQRLGREPNAVELGLFGSLWSEHCGYKHSKPLLKLFPSTSPRVLVGPGVENAGVVDIGEGLGVAMKVESHNHPSAIEPYQGAATGVGGIVRDIFTMGARPIALLNSLRFGPLKEPRNRYLFGGVVGGIAGYGNCLGIPDVAGEIYFAPSYSGNPLVNAMCVGILEKGKFLSARASGAGNLLLLVGADTGRDGIHGASGLASRTFEEERELRPTVQVGNPFLEKLLMEACLELAGSPWVVGLSDLGAAGLTSAAVEAAARGGCGVEIDVLKVSRREEGMTPYEVMLSESQERMLLIVQKGCENEVKEVFDHFELHSEIIGTVI
ncbi:MAG: AIR synthase-related protein, partial [Chloroflexota bacterium]|nr:AIR synthase-related protein [Chloroflexota bacterium]